MVSVLPEMVSAMPGGVVGRELRPMPAVGVQVDEPREHPPPGQVDHLGTSAGSRPAPHAGEATVCDHRETWVEHPLGGHTRRLRAPSCYGRVCSHQSGHPQMPITSGGGW